MWVGAVARWREGGGAGNASALPSREVVALGVLTLLSWSLSDGFSSCLSDWFFSLSDWLLSDWISSLSSLFSSLSLRSSVSLVLEAVQPT